MQDVAGRLANRVQLTTDGLKAYLDAAEGAFRADIDYAQLIKLYGDAPGPAGRYSPAECTGIRKTRVEGQARQGSRQHQLRRAAEPHHADVHAPVHAPHQCVQQEG